MRRPLHRRALLATISVAGFFVTPPASAQPAEAPPKKTDAETVLRVQPPPPNVDFLQFGVAFTGLFNVNPGPICPENAQTPCILGSGGGLTARAGYRSRGPWYVGGAYSFTKIDTNSLLRLGILQQLLAEMRYIFSLGLLTEPYFSTGFGGVAFGNEWGVETVGLTTLVGAGFESLITRSTAVGINMSYRPILFFGWTDRAEQERETGVAHYIGLELVLEAREPLRSH